MTRYRLKLCHDAGLFKPVRHHTRQEQEQVTRFQGPGFLQYNRNTGTL
jgi:hypothetical protein